MSSSRQPGGSQSDVKVTDGLQAFKDVLAGRRKSMPRGSWSLALCFAIADKHVGCAPPTSGDIVEEGQFVEKVAKSLLEREKLKMRLESGLNSIGSNWAKFATTYFKRFGIDYEQCLWNWNKHGNVHDLWTDDDAGRERFATVLGSAIRQTSAHINSVTTTWLRKNRLLKGYEKTWGNRGLQALFDDYFPTRTKRADARKGVLQDPSSRLELLIRAVADLFGDADVETLTVEQAVEIERALRHQYPGLSRYGGAWNLVRKHCPELPRAKPRRSTLRRPDLTHDEAVEFVQDAIARAAGPDWTTTRQGRLTARRLLLGAQEDGTANGTTRRSLHRGLQELGLDLIIYRLRSDVPSILADATPQALHPLDLGRRTPKQWQEEVSSGAARQYIRWVYSTLLDVELPSTDPRATCAFLRAQWINYPAAYGGLREALVDAFGEAEADRCPWARQPRSSSVGEEGKLVQLERLRVAILAELDVDTPDRTAIRKWLQTIARAGKLKDWIQQRKFVQLLRVHFDRDRSKMFVNAFANEGLRPWDVPHSGLRNYDPGQVAEVVRDYWEQLRLNPRMQLQECATALSYGELCKTGLGGLLHQSSPARTTLIEYLCRLAAPDADWTMVAFVQQSKLCTLGLEFEDVVLRALEQTRPDEYEYQARFKLPDDSLLIPDFRLKSVRLRQGFCGAVFLDAKLAISTSLNSDNLRRLAASRRVCVVYAVQDRSPDNVDVPHFAWNDFADRIGLRGGTRRALDDEVDEVTEKRRMVLRGELRLSQSTCRQLGSG